MMVTMYIFSKYGNTCSAHLAARSANDLWLWVAWLFANAVILLDRSWDQRQCNLANSQATSPEHCCLNYTAFLLRWLTPTVSRRGFAYIEYETAPVPRSAARDVERQCLLGAGQQRQTTKADSSRLHG